MSRFTLCFTLSLMCLAFATGHARIFETKSITTSDGLSDLLVNVIYQDSTGYIWLGTESALDRYDGNKIHTFEFPDDLQGSKRVNALLEDGHGNLYVGTHQGLFVLKQHAHRLEQVAKKNISFPVFTLAYNKANGLWIGSSQGLFHLDAADDKLSQILLGPDALSQENKVIGLWANEEDDELWILSQRKLLLYKMSTGDIDDYPIPMPAMPTMLLRLDNTLYIGTSGSGVIPFSLPTRKFGDAINAGNDIITSLTSDGDKRLVIVTDGEGIFEYSVDDNAIVDAHTSATSGLRSNSIYCVFVDRNALWWFGYYQAGVDYTPYHYDIFETYNPEGLIDLSKHEVRSLAVDGNKKLIGTRNGLFYIDEATGYAKAFSRPQMKSNVIFAIEKWNGMYYIGTYGGGIYQFNPASLTLSPYMPDGLDLKALTVFDIAVDSQNAMWLATSVGAYRIMPDGNTKFYNSSNSQLPGGNVYDIYFDSQKRGWISTESGMGLWNGKTITTDRFPKGFINKKKIRVVYEDSDHDLYFAPDRGSVVRTNASITDIREIKLGNDNYQPNVTFIVEDDDHHIWLGSDKGLIRYDKNNDIRYFGNQHGLNSTIFTLCTPVIDAQGNICMGNTAGITMLPKSKIGAIDSINPSPLSISSIESNGRCIYDRITTDDGSIKINLGSDEKDLAVYVSDFTYSDAKQNMVEYMLDGYDQAWHTSTGFNPIKYSDIPPGSHTLKLRRPGYPEKVTEIAISKSKSWMHESLLALLALACIALAILSVRLIRHARRKNEAKADDQAAKAPEQAKVPYKTTRISDEECKRLIKKVEGIMRTEKPYLNPDLKIGDLAAMTESSSHSLSFLFNQFMKTSYSDYINSWRVDEFKRMAKTTDLSKYTLTALALKCGFSSRASFFRHFKARTGVTPAEYIQQSQH